MQETQDKNPGKGGDKRENPEWEGTRLLQNHIGSIGLEDADGQGFNSLAKDLMLDSAMPGLWEWIQGREVGAQ